MTDTLRIDAFQAEIVPITPAARGLLHELTVSVHWPHREADIDLLIRLGRGHVALDPIGRPLAAAMHFPMGPDFAMLGMMVTPPRLQAQGAGRALLTRILADCAGRDLRLNATPQGYRLYRGAGFVDVGTVWQHQGIVTDVAPPPPPPGVTLAPLGTPPGARDAADSAALAELDARAFGAPRPQVLAALTAVSSGLIARHDGRPCGYGLLRRFGKGHVLGPLVAETEALAIHLAAALMRQVQGGFLRLDTPDAGPGFRAFLTAAGLRAFDTVTEMRLGPHRRATRGPVTFALAAHSLG